MIASDGAQDFESFFRTLWPAAFNLARRVLGNPEDAEDAASEAFARALVSWGRVRWLPHRDAWLLRVVSNVAIDGARKRARMQAPPAEVVLDHGELSILRAAMIDALAALPRRQREVMVLRHFAGYGEQAVAETLGVSTNSVKKHTSRALRRLRTQLGDYIQEV